MATTEITKVPMDVGEAALVMAIGIVFERVSRLSAADKKDLLALVKELAHVKDREEVEAIRNAMVEILDQDPSGILRLETPTEMPMKLKKWVAYVSTKMRELRQAKGWTQQDLAKKTGLPQSHISRLEAGQHSPSFTTVNRLASAFGVEITVLDPR